jgi:hypothetical protein
MKPNEIRIHIWAFELLEEKGYSLKCLEIPRKFDEHKTDQ